MSRHSAKGSRWRKVAALVKERDNHQCAQCGATDDLTVDHAVTPISLMTPEQKAAGEHLDPEQLVTLCRTHNSSKGNRTEAETRPTWLNPRWFGQDPPFFP